MINEKLQALFHDAEDRLMLKSVLFGVAPRSMAFVTLSPEAYEDGIKCMIDIECTADENPDQNTLDIISITTSDYLCQQWDLDSKLSEIGINPESLNWWPVSISAH